MKRIILLLLSVVLFACTSVSEIQPNLELNGFKLPINGDTAVISEQIWQRMGLKNYPFTKVGDPACSFNAVEFYPGGLKETDIGLPLNKIALDIQ